MDVILGNTLAISTCSDKTTFSIRHHLKKKTAQFASSFGDQEVLWPQDPFIARGVLYIPLLVVQVLEDAEPPFNFKIAGHKIARIRNFVEEDPHQWPVDYLDWSPALAPGIEALATTSIVYQNHVYFYPLYRRAGSNLAVSGNILARIPVNHLDNPENHFEYWMKSGAWNKDLKPEDVKIIFPAGVSELSVRYHAQDRAWMAVYLSPENKGDRLVYRSSAKLAGPWSPPAAFTEAVAEVTPQTQLYHSGTFCYAGKEHRQFSGQQPSRCYLCVQCSGARRFSAQESFPLPAGGKETPEAFPLKNILQIYP